LPEVRRLGGRSLFPPRTQPGIPWMVKTWASSGRFKGLRGLPRSGIGPSGEHPGGAQYTTARWPACGRCPSQSPLFPPSWHHQHGGNRADSAAQPTPPLCVRIGGAEDMEVGTGPAPPYPPMLSVDRSHQKTPSTRRG